MSIFAHDGNSHILECSDNKVLPTILGAHDSNLSLLGRLLDTELVHKGNLIYISEETPIDVAGRVFLILKSLFKQVKNGGHPQEEDILSLFRLTSPPSAGITPTAIKHKKPAPAVGKKPTRKQEQPRSLNFRKASIAARSHAQTDYLKALSDNDVIFALGPAGVGKTFLAVAHAVHRLQQGLIEKIILTRPAVEAGEHLGFLPGDIQEKLDPYLRPLFDALEEFIPHEELARKIENKVIEIAPLGYMRGRTLKRACIILDEAQNVTSAQLRMFLTRMGSESQVIVAGDPSQIDLPVKAKSGLEKAANKLSHIDRITVCNFSSRDSMRHPVVEQILDAYGDDL